MFALPLSRILKDFIIQSLQETMIFSEKLPKVRLEFGKKGFYYQGAKIFNDLPVGVRSLTSRILFKKALKSHFS